MNFNLSVEFDLSCLYLEQRRSLLFMRHFMLQVTQGCPSFGLHILWERISLLDYSSGTWVQGLFSAFLNSAHLILVPHEEWFS